MHQPIESRGSDRECVAGRATVMQPAQPARPAQLARPTPDLNGDTVVLPTSRLPAGGRINLPGRTTWWNADHAPAARLDRKAA